MSNPAGSCFCILFHDHPEIDQLACDKIAEEITGGRVSPMKWQGANSYTVESGDQQTIVQFRSVNETLRLDTMALARAVHGKLAPSTEQFGRMLGSQVSIWTMEKLPGLGFDYLIFDADIASKTKTAVADMAKFYAASWKCPQVPTPEQVELTRDECSTKLAQLCATLPENLRDHVDRAKETLVDVLQLPWVLTHADLSSSNLLFDQQTGHLTGVVDWADAALWPFGKALWGLNSVLGYSNNDGWHWLGDVKSNEQIFCKVFEAEVGELSREQRARIEGARVLGLLLRWGFVWKEGAMVPLYLVDDRYHYLTMLGICLNHSLWP